MAFTVPFGFCTTTSGRVAPCVLAGTSTPSEYESCSLALLVRSSTVNSESLGEGIVLDERYNLTASLAPPEITPVIAPHLKLSLPAKIAAFFASSKSPV